MFAELYRSTRRLPESALVGSTAVAIVGPVAIVLSGDADDASARAAS